MPVYRCYFIADQRVAAVEIIDCAGDAAARDRALEALAERNRERPRYSGIELWDLARLVCIHPDEPSPTVLP